MLIGIIQTSFQIRDAFIRMENESVKISVLFFIWNKKEAKVCEVGLVKRKKIPLDSSRVYLCIGLAADIGSGVSTTID